MSACLQSDQNLRANTQKILSNTASLGLGHRLIFLCSVYWLVDSRWEIEGTLRGLSYFVSEPRRVRCSGYLAFFLISRQALTLTSAFLLSRSSLRRDRKS